MVHDHEIHILCEFSLCLCTNNHRQETFSISVDIQSQSIFNLSGFSISLDFQSQLLSISVDFNFSQLSISVGLWSQSIVNLSQFSGWQDNFWDTNETLLTQNLGFWLLLHLKCSPLIGKTLSQLCHRSVLNQPYVNLIMLKVLVTDWLTD